MRKRLAFALALLILPAVSVIAAESPQTVKGAATVSSQEAKALFDKKAAFVDVRNDSDWDAGRIPGAVHLDIKGKFDKSALSAVAKPDQDVVIYCNGASCLRSSEASAQAASWGYSKVHYYRDGFPAWQAAGYPVE